MHKTDGLFLALRQMYHGAAPASKVSQVVIPKDRSRRSHHRLRNLEVPIRDPGLCHQASSITSKRRRSHGLRERCRLAMYAESSSPLSIS